MVNECQANQTLHVNFILEPFDKNKYWFVLVKNTKTTCKVPVNSLIQKQTTTLFIQVWYVRAF